MAVAFYINGEQLDMFADEAINLVTRQKDIRDINKIFDDFSREFSVPASGINNTILSRFPDSSISVIPRSSKDYRIRQPSEIEVDGVLYKTGSAKYIKAVYQFGKLSHHLLQFTGSILTMNELLGDISLQDLDLTHLAHNTDAINVRKGMDYNDALFDNKIIYPLISSTANINQSVLESGTVAAIVGTSIAARPLEPTDFRPAIQVVELLDAINKYALTTTDGQTSLNLTLDPTLNLDNLYLWMGNNPSDSFTLPEPITYGPPDGSLSGPNTGVLNPSTGVTTLVNLPDYLKLFWDFDLTNIAAGAVWQIKGWNSVTNTDDDNSWVEMPGTELNGTGPGGGVAVLNVYENYLIHEEWRFYMKFTLTIDNAEPISINTCLIAETTSNNAEEFYCADNLSYNAVPGGANVAERLPAIPVIDLIVGITKLYNLVPRVGCIGTGVDFELVAYDNWVGTYGCDLRPNFWDITPEVDITSHVITLPAIPKSVSVIYQEPKAWKNKYLYFEPTGVGYGDKVIVGTGGLGEPLEIEVPFENLAWIGGIAPVPTPYLVGHAFDSPIDYSVSNNPQPYNAAPTPITDSSFLMIWDKSVYDPAENPPTADVNINVNGFTTPVTKYKMCNSYDFVPATTEQVTNTLNFSRETDFFRYLIREGSYNINYFPYLEQLLNPSARLHTYDAVIGIAKLSQITAASYLKIKDQWFIINSMEADTLTRKTKLELITYFRQYVATPPTYSLFPPAPPHDVFPIGNDAPTAPFNLVGSDKTATGFTLSWSPSTSVTAPILTYEIWRNGSLWTTVTGNPAPTSVILTAPDDDNAQWYVRGIDGQGLISDYSEPFDWALDPPIFTEPIFLVTATDTTIEISFNPATFFQGVLSQYKKYLDGVLISAAPTTTYTYLGLIPDTEYTIQVQVTDTNGLDDWSNEYKFSTLPPPALTMGAVTTLALGGNEIKIEWIEATGPNPIVEYNIQIAGITVDTVPVGTLVYNITGLSPKTNYDISIEVVDSVGATDTSPVHPTLTQRQAFFMSTVASTCGGVNPVAPAVYWEGGGGTNAIVPSVGATVYNFATGTSVFNGGGLTYLGKDPDASFTSAITIDANGLVTAETLCP